MHTNPYIAAWRNRVAGLQAVAAAVGIRNEVSPRAQALIDELDELRERQRRLVDRSQVVLDAATREGRELTAEERRAVSRRTDEVEQLEERAAEIETELSQSQGRLTPRNAGDPPSAAEQQMMAARRTGGQRMVAVVNLTEPPQRPTAESLFGLVQPRARAGIQTGPSGDAGAESFGRWLFALATRDTQYLLRNAGATSMVGAEGGFAVPTAFSAALFNAVVEQSFFLSRCRVLPMTADAQSFPVLNNYDRTKGPGKLTTDKKAEGAAATVQTPTLEEITLRANKRIVYWTVTNEMLQGAMPGTDRALINAAAGAIAMQIDREVWSGSGAGEMLGITSSPALIVASKDGSQAANTVTYSNLTNMLARLLPSAYNRAVWFTSPSVLPQLLAVYNPVMNASNVVGGLPAPMTQLPDGSYALFGRPLLVTDFAPALSSQGDLSLFDLSQYLIAMREELRVEVSPHVAFDEDKVAFKVVQRRAGQPIPSQVFTPAVGSATLSPFVQLQAR